MNIKNICYRIISHKPRNVKCGVRISHDKESPHKDGFLKRTVQQEVSQLSYGHFSPLLAETNWTFVPKPKPI